MAVLEIVKYPDPRLREETFDVEDFEAAGPLVKDLIETMYSQNAAGIAAIQVGRMERIFIIDGGVATGDESAEPLVFVNPELLETGRGTSVSDEGCLSFPGAYVQIKRPNWAKMRAKNAKGEVFEVDGDGLFGRALQHELDHLNGRLMIDLVGMVKKEMIKRKMKRYLEEQKA